MPEPIATALIAHLVRIGVLDGDDIDAIGKTLDADGETEAAHEARCAFLEAGAPTASEFRADQARARFRVVADGGNDAT